MVGNLLTGAMDLVYENSVSSIESLQSRFLHRSDMFFMISNICDPRYAFLFYSPLIISLDWRVGKRVMWVTVIVEWMNHILKWALHGERPYWWIRETQVYNKTGITTPDIHQFFLTCETGPGSPSGHAMVTAAVFYAILHSYQRKFYGLKKNSGNLIAKFCWLAYVVLLIVVSASRIFIAAHFPHQCFLGIALGCLVAWSLENIDRKKFNTIAYCGVTAVLLATALSLYAILKAIGVNPMWSVDRAIKWCAKPEYVHLDTTPFFSMMRYCGFMFGMGFGFNGTGFQRLSKGKFTVAMKIACAALSVGICKLSEKISLPKENMNVFYILAFFVNAFLAYAMVSGVPYLVSLLASEPSQQKSKKRN